MLLFIICRTIDVAVVKLFHTWGEGVVRPTINLFLGERGSVQVSICSCVPKVSHFQTESDLQQFAEVDKAFLFCLWCLILCIPHLSPTRGLGCIPNRIISSSLRYLTNSYIQQFTRPDQRSHGTMNVRVVILICWASRPLYYLSRVGTVPDTTPNFKWPRVPDIELNVSTMPWYV